MAEDRVVEGAQIEALSETLLLLAPQGLDLTLADLVGEGLGRPDDVAIAEERLPNTRPLAA